MKIVNNRIVYSKHEVRLDEACHAQDPSYIVQMSKDLSEFGDAEDHRFELKHMHNDGSWTVHTRNLLSDEDVVETEEKGEVKMTTTAKKANNAPKERTKKDHAIEVFNSMKGSPRKEVIEAFMNEVGLTKAGASTYYHNISKM